MKGQYTHTRAALHQAVLVCIKCADRKPCTRPTLSTSEPVSRGGSAMSASRALACIMYTGPPPIAHVLLLMWSAGSITAESWLASQISASKRKSLDPTPLDLHVSVTYRSRAVGLALTLPWPATVGGQGEAQYSLDYLRKISWPHSFLVVQVCKMRNHIMGQ